MPCRKRWLLRNEPLGLPRFFETADGGIRVAGIYMEESMVGRDGDCMHFDSYEFRWKLSARLDESAPDIIGADMILKSELAGCCIWADLDFQVSLYWADDRGRAYHLVVDWCSTTWALRIARPEACVAL